MVQMRVQTYTGATERDNAETAARALAATLHKLHGGDRTESVDLSRLSPALRAKAEAKILAGTLGQTTGYSAVVLAPTDLDDPDAGGEVRMLIGAGVQAQLTEHGPTRLTEPERAAVAQAVADAVERGRPAPGGAGGAGREITDGSDRGQP